MNCCVVLTANEGDVGVTAIELSTGVTVTPVEPLTDPIVAEIVVVPLATAVARPEALIDAMELELEAQVTCEVRSLVLPSL